MNEQWDCGFVNHSKYAVFPPPSFDEKPGTKHVPVAIVGIAGYSAIAVAALSGFWFVTWTLVEIGFAAACFLSYLEAFVLQKWCIYCVWSQGIFDGAAGRYRDWHVAALARRFASYRKGAIWELAGARRWTVLRVTT